VGFSPCCCSACLHCHLGSGGAAVPWESPRCRASRQHSKQLQPILSVDFGLLHLVALDLNMYYGTDSCGDSCRLAQIQWLQEDLRRANLNRGAVPWVIAMSHFPFYCTGCAAASISADYYESQYAEIYGNANHSAAAMRKKKLSGSFDDRSSSGKTVKGSSDASIKDLMPLIHEGGVDMYLAGHWHYYESLYPAEVSGSSIGGKSLQKDFRNPNVTVHVTTGNGGPPSADNFREDCPGDDCNSIPSTRKQSVNFGFGRLIAHNHTHLQYQQVRNKGSVVEDDWVLIQQQHGPRKSVPVAID